MKKVGSPEAIPERFDRKSFQAFLLELDSLNQDLLYRDPIKAGWSLVCTLKGEGEDAPDLFQIYQKDGRKAVILSDFVNHAATDSAAATSGDQYEPSAPKALQARKSRGWSSVVSLIHLFDTSPEVSLEHRKLHSQLIATGVSKLILGDLDLLCSPKITPDQQAAIAKEAGAAYESGLKNFLTAVGKREKKGTPRRSTSTIPLPWEWLAVLRVQQFIYNHGKLPVREWLIKQLQDDGVAYQESKGRGNSKWRELLKRAGLDSLPKHEG